MWLTDGSTEGAPATPESAPADPKPALSNPADGAEPLPGLPMPTGSYTPPGQSLVAIARNEESLDGANGDEANGTAGGDDEADEAGADQQ